MIMLMLALLILAAVAIFSVQNALSVSVMFLVWQFQASLAIVIFISVFAGVLIASTVFAGIQIRRRGKKRKNKLLLP